MFRCLDSIKQQKWCVLSLQYIISCKTLKHTFFGNLLYMYICINLRGDNQNFLSAFFFADFCLKKKKKRMAA